MSYRVEDEARVDERLAQGARWAARQAALQYVTEQCVRSLDGKMRGAGITMNADHIWFIREEFMRGFTAASAALSGSALVNGEEENG